MIPDFNFNPINGLRDAAVYKTNPETEADAREQIQRGLDQIKDYLNLYISGEIDSKNITVGNIDGVNGTVLFDALRSLQQNIVNAVHPATNISVKPFSGVTSRVLQNALEEIYTAIADTALGNIPNGSIDEIKLQNVLKEKIQNNFYVILKDTLLPVSRRQRGMIYFKLV